MTAVIRAPDGGWYLAGNHSSMEPHYYNVDVTWNSERKGVMCSPELKSGTISNGCIDVATPPQFPKGVEGIWSPEHLFTAAIASCFMTTFLAIAENSKLNFKAFSCTAKGKLDKPENQPMTMTEVLLYPSVTLYDEADRERAIRVLNKSEQACLITNSVKSRVTMEPSVVISTESVAQ